MECTSTLFVTYIWKMFAASVVDMPYIGDLGGTRETFGHVFLPLHSPNWEDSSSVDRHFSRVVASTKQPSLLLGSVVGAGQCRVPDSITSAFME